MKQDIENTNVTKNDLDFIAHEAARLEQQIENAQMILSDLENLYERGMPVKALSLKKVRAIYDGFYSRMGSFFREQSELWKTTLNPNKAELDNIHAMQNNSKRLDTIVNRILFLADNIDTLSDEVDKFDLLGKQTINRLH